MIYELISSESPHTRRAKKKHI